jgi:catechol 2,3-dioxygenase-like lactoylglutathione lyase family enzyme
MRPRVTSFAPQFLVDDLERSIGYYEKLGFTQHNPSINWADLAVDFGYFDQSHLISEFLEFSGLSLTDYINRHKRIIEHNIHVKR